MLCCQTTSSLPKSRGSTSTATSRNAAKLQLFFLESVIHDERSNSGDRELHRFVGHGYEWSEGEVHLAKSYYADDDRAYTHTQEGRRAVQEHPGAQRNSGRAAFSD